MLPENNRSIIYLAGDIAMKYISHAYEIYDGIDSFRPTRYIADRRNGEGKKKVMKRVRLITALVQNRPHSRQHIVGWCRTLLHHPLRPCLLAPTHACAIHLG